MTYNVKPIGFVRNRFKSSNQPETIMAGESIIELDPEYEEGLFCIEESEFIKIIFLLDRSKEYNLKLQTRSGRLKGVFASRSPNRPNSIGTTVARLTDVEGRILYVKGLDALDGTPVIDIKPFSPLFDSPGMDGPYIDVVHMSDKDEVVELCSRVWDGWDYIPDVFEDWVMDGGFHCIRKGRKIVALGKYTRRKNGLIWLEGLRVHPDHIGKGYARLISNRLLEFLSYRNWSTLRFMTADIGKEARHMAHDDGFTLVGEYHYIVKNGTEDSKGIRGVRRRSSEPKSDSSEPKMLYEDVSLEKNFQDVWNFVSRSKEYIENHRQFFRSWCAWDMDEELVAKEVEKGNCFSTRGKDLEALAFISYYEPYNSLSISFIGGSEEGMRKLMRYAMKRVEEEELSLVEMKTASQRTADMALEEGMEYGHAGQGLIYEMPREDFLQKRSNKYDQDSIAGEEG